MEYLLKSILCLLLLLLFHRMVLQQEVLYRFNRFFLLAAVMGSFLIPLVTIEVVHEVAFAPVSTEVFAEGNSSDEPSQGIVEIPVLGPKNQDTAEIQIPWQEIGWTVYLLGVIVFLVRFIRNIRLIHDQIRKNFKVTFREETVVLVSDSIAPFSFLKYIFYQKEAFENTGIPDAVFLHEQCHVREKHSWDILFIEGLLVIFWFHPGLYLARRAVQLNHEFIADQQVIKQFPVKDYQYLLISILSGEQGFSLGSSLNFPLTKKRFAMMKKSSKPGIQALKIASLVGFLGIMIAIFAEKVAVSAPIEQSEKESSNEPKSIAIHVNADGALLLNGNPINQQQLIEELSKINGEKTIVNLTADPKLKMGELADVQDLLRENDVRKVRYLQAEGQKETSHSESARERHYRNAIFLIESVDMEYTQKRYADLSEKEKIGLLFKDKPVEKKRPDAETFERWKNKDEYALWIDGKSVVNSVLANYKAEDFDWFFQSGVKANARSARFPQPFQVHLNSPKYFEERFGPNSEMFRPKTNQDTITLTQRMVTWHKDISRYPDPVTAFLQKNARYEKLKASPNASDPEVKAEIQQLFEELDEAYSKTQDNRKPRIKKPIPPQTSNSGTLSFEPGLDDYVDRFANYQTQINKSGFFSGFSQEEMKQLEKEFQILESRFSKLPLEEKMQTKRPAFPFAKLTQGNQVVYKKLADLTDQEKQKMAC